MDRKFCKFLGMIWKKVGEYIFTATYVFVFDPESASSQQCSEVYANCMHFEQWRCLSLFVCVNEKFLYIPWKLVITWKQYIQERIKLVQGRNFLIRVDYFNTICFVFSFLIECINFRRLRVNLSVSLCLSVSLWICESCRFESNYFVISFWSFFCYISSKIIVIFFIRSSVIIICCVGISL